MQTLQEMKTACVLKGRSPEEKGTSGEQQGSAGRESRGPGRVSQCTVLASVFTPSLHVTTVRCSERWRSQRIPEALARPVLGMAPSPTPPPHHAGDSALALTFSKLLIFLVSIRISNPVLTPQSRHGPASVLQTLFLLPKTLCQGD